jgi:glutathione peroxidase-family protein
MKKSEVNGGGMNEVYAWLKSNTTDSGSIKWYVILMTNVKLG